MRFQFTAHMSEKRNEGESMEQHKRPRFEFRVFGNPLNQPLEQIIQGTPVERTEQQRDIYVLSPNAQQYNVKIRDNNINTKILMRQQEGLERWHPHLNVAFPLSAPFLHEILLPLLQVVLVPLEQESYSVDAFQHEIVDRHPLLQMVSVHKQRRHYQVGECRLEVAILYVNDNFYTHTTAIEAVNPDAVQQLRTQLGWLTDENVNYSCGLQELLACDTTEPYTFSFAEQVGFSPIPV